MKTKAEMPDCYSAENLMNYHIAVALVDNMAKEGLLSEADKKKLYAVLGKRHGIDSDSIYAV